MVNAKREVRFAAGTPDGRHSRVWKLWATGSEVFMAIRTAGAVYKCSLHSARGLTPPVCQLSITSEMQRKLPDSVGLPNGSRHMKRWERAGPTPDGQWCAVRLYLPYEGMRRATIESGKPVTWLCDPTEGQLADMRVVFCAETVAAEARKIWGDPWRLLTDWPLPNGERCRAFYVCRGTTPIYQTRTRDFLSEVKSNPLSWSSGDIDYESPDVGLLAHGQQSDGIYTLADLFLTLEH